MVRSGPGPPGLPGFSSPRLPPVSKTSQWHLAGSSRSTVAGGSRAGIHTGFPFTTAQRDRSAISPPALPDTRAQMTVNRNTHLHQARRRPLKTPLVDCRECRDAPPDRGRRGRVDELNSLIGVVLTPTGMPGDFGAGEPYPERPVHLGRGDLSVRIRVLARAPARGARAGEWL